MNAETLAQTLAIQFNYTAWVFRANLKGLSDDDTLHGPEAGGNGANWVAGHIAQSRTATLALVGAEAPFSTVKYERYVRGSAPLSAAAEAVPLAEIVADMTATQELLLAGLPTLTDEALAAKAPFSPSDDENETVGSLLVGLAFHEAYHTGQLGILRRVSGAEGVVK